MLPMLVRGGGEAVSFAQLTANRIKRVVSTLKSNKKAFSG